MLRTGVVVREDKGIAEILVIKTAACGAGGCSSCGGCESKPMTIKMPNTIGAGIGDTVAIQAQAGTVLKNAMAAYLLPLAGLLLGVLISGMIVGVDGSADGIIFLSAILGTIAGYGLLKVLDYFVLSRAELYHLSHIVDLTQGGENVR